MCLCPYTPTTFWHILVLLRQFTLFTPDPCIHISSLQPNISGLVDFFLTLFDVKVELLLHFNTFYLPTAATQYYLQNFLASHRLRRSKSEAYLQLSSKTNGYSNR